MEKRSLLNMILLGLVTLGIYYIYWFFATRNEMVAKEQKFLQHGWQLFHL
jgi:hypothetical protein